MNSSQPLVNVNVDDLVSNQKLFRSFVYTPRENVMKEVFNRQKNTALLRYLERFLGGDIPGPLRNETRAVIFRQVISPNHELQYFIKSAATLKLKPILLEFYEDKFLGINPVKRFLGKLRLQQSISSEKIETYNILDFNSSNGMKIKDVRTNWDQSLIGFHHELLRIFASGTEELLFDASDWFRAMGGCASNYYAKYLCLFMKHGVLFENFSFSKNELKFVKDIFLPAFIAIWHETGLKPLICELLPSDTQDDNYWLSYPFDILRCLRKKIAV